MPLKKDITVEEIIEILSRRKWLIIYSLLLIMFIASVYCVKATEMFTSKTSILVIPPEISSEIVNPTVSRQDLGLRVNTLTKRILTRTRMRGLIDTLNLFPKVRDEESKDKLVKLLASRIDINVSRRGNSFDLAYSHEDPITALRVTSSLASMFINENLKARSQQVVGTTEFLDAALKKAKITLDDKDEHIKKFRIKYFGELPEQLDTNIKTLARLEGRLKDISTNRRNLEEELVKTDTKLADLKSKAATMNVDLAIFEDRAEIDTSKLPKEVVSLLKQIAEKKDQVLAMRIQYTDNHPLMKQSLHVIEELEKKLKATQFEDEDMRKTLERYLSVPIEAQGLLNKSIILKERKKAIKEDLKNLKDDKEETNRQIALYNTRIENTPKRELEIKDLTRDYETIKAHYDRLLAKKMNAELSEDLEKKQKGEQFQMLDPPSLPDKPSSPDRPRILGYGLFLSLIIGFGGAFGLEFLNRSIATPREFKYFFEIPILVSLPLIHTREDNKRALLKKTLLYGGLILYIVAVVLFVTTNIEKIQSLLPFIKPGV